LSRVLCPPSLNNLESEMPAEQQQPQQPVAGMPQVNPNLLAGDDYVYEAKMRAKKEVNSQQAGTGGMSSQFEIVSSPLYRNN
jgi:hypothetical protein